MALNQELVDIFTSMAQVLQITGANRFRTNAYQRAARAIKELDRDIANLAQEPKALTELDGIGKGLAEKIIEYIDTGNIEEYDQLMAEVPDGLVDMLDIAGLGPKTVAKLWHEAGITNTAQLKNAIDNNTLDHIEGIGKKTLEKLTKSIQFKQQSADRVRLGRALPTANHMIELLHQLPGVEQIDYAGSIRRGRDTIGDIDILIGTDDPETFGPAIADRFCKHRHVEEVLAHGNSKCSIRIDAHIQIDLRIVHTQQYGAALAYFTGSRAHNIAMRKRAQAMGLQLNEYGLWHRDHANQDQPVAAATEQDIYQALQLPWIPPPLREDRGEMQLTELPNLITRNDIGAELHAHTTASDGKLTVAELAAVAAEHGYHTIGITDHSRAQAIANGLSADALEAHIQNVRQVNAERNDIQVLAGTEVDILADGKLDYPNTLLKELDLVIASPHAALDQDGKKATRRLLKAMDNPHVHIIGHPTGRLIGKRPAMPLAIDQIVQHAAQTHTALELNANPWRLDLKDTHVRAAIEAGAMISINTDAHRGADLDYLIYGILTAQRGWATPDNVINCMAPDKLLAWLQAKSAN